MASVQHIGDAISNSINSLDALEVFYDYSFYDTLIVRNFNFPCVVISALSTSLENFSRGDAVPVDFLVNVLIVKQVGATDSFSSIQGDIETLMVDSILPTLMGEAINDIRHYGATHMGKNVVVSSLTIKIPRR